MNMELGTIRQQLHGFINLALKTILACMLDTSLLSNHNDIKNKLFENTVINYGRKVGQEVWENSGCTSSNEQLRELIQLYLLPGFNRNRCTCCSEKVRPKLFRKLRKNFIRNMHNKASNQLSKI